MLRVAQFGAGRIGKIHANNIAGHGRSTLVAIADPHAESAAALAATHGAKVMDESAIYADPDIDAIVVASSTNVHAIKSKWLQVLAKRFFAKSQLI